MRKNKKSKAGEPSFFRRLRRFLRNSLLLFVGISLLWVLLARFVPVWVTPLMYIRAGEALLDSRMPRWKKDWVSIDHISPHMPQAVVASEDNLFMEHWGFSMADINKAIRHNKQGKRIRGGSTISQQTAKNVFLWPERSYIRKAFEAYFTLLIEAVWSKKRIMEVYLNVIEMGDGIYGVEAAAQAYFGKKASQLSRSECARIAACLPNPRRFKANRPSPYIKRREAQILNLMTKVSPVDFEPKGKPKQKKDSKNKRK